MITKKDIIEFIKHNNIGQSVICLHSSLKSFGQVENGAATIIDGFIESNCTLVCPSFYYESATFPRINYKNNGINYEKIETGLSDMTFQQVNYEESIDQIDKSMGIIPKYLLKYSETKRTKNPMNSFCINGQYSNDLITGESLDNAYSVYKNILKADKIKSYIVLAGVDFTSCTPLHFAEELAGRKLFRRWAIYNSETVEVEVGSCSDGFEKIRDHIRDIEVIDVIGSSTIRIYPFKEFIIRTSKIIQKEPSITICNDKCERCIDMFNGGRCS